VLDSKLPGAAESVPSTTESESTKQRAPSARPAINNDSIFLHEICLAYSCTAREQSLCHGREPIAAQKPSLYTIDSALACRCSQVGKARTCTR
jgi:hypothetical protein